MLNIASVWYPVRTLGYGNRLGVWVQGCLRKCRNCISPEFSIVGNGRDMTPEEIFTFIPDKSNIDGMTVSGGEPFDQAEELLALIKKFNEFFSDDILIYTGYKIEELYHRNDSITNEIINSISVLIDGEYIEEKNDGLGLRGSSNQKIHIFKNKDRYINAEISERKMQGVLLHNRLWMIGIPPEK